MKVSEDDRDEEDIDERDFKKEEPPEPHQLVPAKARQRPADPHHEKDQRAYFREKDGNVDEPENPAVRAIGNSREMPAAEEKRRDNSRAGDHCDVLPEKKQSELHRR